MTCRWRGHDAPAWFPLKATGAWQPPTAHPADFSVANAVMLTKDVVISDTYINRLKQDYAAEVFRNTGPDKVNRWVARMTHGKITRIIDELPAKGIVLLDVVYFKQAWRIPFSARETRNQGFHLSPTRTIKVATMHRQSYFPVVSQPGYRAIRLPYRSERFSMVIILPDIVDGATALAKQLNTNELAKLLVSFGQKEVYTDLSLPRFRTSFAVKLKDTYQQLGLVQPFDAKRADFSGMTGYPKEQVKVWIDDILHRAALEVTENGTEAVAATATSLAQVTSVQYPEPFTVDRPFLFYIMDDATGLVLFAGRISDPSKVN
jgi:serpin B